jgi:hypothetical protein
MHSEYVYIVERWDMVLLLLLYLEISAILLRDAPTVAYTRVLRAPPRNTGPRHANDIVAGRCGKTYVTPRP